MNMFFSIKDVKTGTQLQRAFAYVQANRKNLIIDGYFFQEREIIFD